jgi:hypothetical protein
MSSFKVEVIADSSGKWVGNLLRFSTKADAETYARDLAQRWTAVLDHRVVPSEDKPQHRWHLLEQRAVHLDLPAGTPQVDA